MVFGLNPDAEVLAEALEAYVGGVLIVVVMGMWELGKTVLRNILGAYDARFARNRDSLARWSCFFGVLVAFSRSRLTPGGAIRYSEGGRLLTMFMGGVSLEYDAIIAWSWTNLMWMRYRVEGCRMNSDMNICKLWSGRRTCGLRIHRSHLK